MITIEVDDRAVQAALAQLQGRLSNLTPAMRAIGESIMERTKQRFASSTGPDGSRWAPNADVVLRALLHRGKGNFKQTKKDGSGGGLSAKGQRTLSGKKPLIDTGDLSRGFHYSADATSVTVSSSRTYSSAVTAAIHQFGGKAGRGHKVTIPARPFLPITASGELYPQDRDLIVAELQRFILQS